MAKNAWIIAAAVVAVILLLWFAVRRGEQFYIPSEVLDSPIRWYDPAHPPDEEKLQALLPPHKPGTIFIHLMYMPWNKEGRLLENETTYDKDFVNQFTKQIEEHSAVSGHPFAVKMWTRSEVETFSNLWCPGLWGALMHKIQLAKNHPVMLVDLYRWLVVYCYGGIYWQFGSKLVGNTLISDFMPRDSSQNVKLFTETILTPQECMANGQKYRIRGGVPEEPLRICTQIFYATPRNDFVALMLDEIVHRLNTLDVYENYDILYITGNAVLPTVYDRAVDYHALIELVDLAQRDRMISMSSRASWRRAELE